MREKAWRKQTQTMLSQSLKRDGTQFTARTIYSLCVYTHAWLTLEQYGCEPASPLIHGFSFTFATSETARPISPLPQSTQCEGKKDKDLHDEE